jgi:intein-encoded DNA endonuclease-like protein
VSKKIVIPKEALYRLYWLEHKSSIEIGKIYSCHPMTIRNRIKEFGIQKRTPSDARMRYSKQDFSGNIVEKAYMLGFRLGDLNVYQTGRNSDLIVARCHTTQHVQVELMNDLFSSYGKMSISSSLHGFNINCYLNKTFAFLLPKHRKIPQWILNQEAEAWSFVAGYVDAEGYFALNQSRGRFKIDSYDVFILQGIISLLKKQSIRFKFRQIATRGQAQYSAGIFHRDLWRLDINEARSLLNFIYKVGFYIKHKKRKTDMIKCQNNIEDRIKRGSVV